MIIIEMPYVQCSILDGPDGGRALAFIDERSGIAVRIPFERENFKNLVDIMMKSASGIDVARVAPVIDLSKIKRR